MPHFRNRYLTQILEDALKFSPLVGVLGHRQVGKTTLVSSISPEYLTLDDEDQKALAIQSPKKFIGNLKKHKTVIDEAQMVPGIFPALKERVRLDPRPGQFLLTGSVRFTSKKAIQESLTGRILNFDLMPFSVSEIKHLSLPNTGIKILESKNLEGTLDQLEGTIKSSKNLLPEFELFLERGGLPSICFIRNNKMRELKIIDQLKTILDRDLRSIHPTQLTGSQLLEYCGELAQRQGLPIKYSQLTQKTQISDVLQKKLLFAMEAMYLIRIIPLRGDRSGFTIFFEDQAESRWLADGKIDPLMNDAIALFRNVRVQFSYRVSQQPKFFQYNTRAGVRIPFAVETSDGIVGFIFIEGEHPNKQEMASAGSFLREFEKAKMIFVTKKFEYQCINSRSILLPVSALV